MTECVPTLQISDSLKRFFTESTLISELKILQRDFSPVKHHICSPFDFSCEIAKLLPRISVQNIVLSFSFLRKDTEKD